MWQNIVGDVLVGDVRVTSARSDRLLAPVSGAAGLRFLFDVSIADQWKSARYQGKGT